MTNRLIWYKKEKKHIQRYYFQYRDGFTREENLSEELDSMTIVIDRIDKYEFEPFDVVDLLADEQTTRTMLIDKIVETQVSFEPEKFTYTLQLMSLTKRLERTIIPNFSVTKPLNSSARKIYNVLNTLLSNYAPKFLYCSGETTYYQKFYTISNRLKAKTQNVDCPDIQIGNATLREAIDRILSVVSCICILRPNGYLDYIDLDNHEIADYESKEIDLDNLPQLNYKTENQDSGEYASELENNYRNVVQTTDENRTVKILEFIGLRSPDSAYTNTDNLELMTSRPIYEIKSLKMTGRITYQQDGHEVIENSTWDLTPYVYEQSEYKLLNYETQLKTLIYTRDSKNIVGFDSSAKRFFYTYTYFERIIQEITGDTGFRFGNRTTGVGALNDIQKLYFTVEYYSQVDNLKLRSGKYLPETNDKNVIMDNPTEAYVDIKQQGRLFNKKANRLGNRIKTLQGRFNISDIDLAPNIGDTLGNFVVIRTEKQYYNDFMLVKAILSENFININYFTGINARRRSWNVVSQNEAFDKELLQKYYLEFSFENKVGVDVNNGLISYYYDITNMFVVNIMRDAITSETISKSVSGAIVWTPQSGEELRTSIVNNSDDGKYFFLETSSYISGNSLVFNCGFDGNKSSGIRISNILSDRLTFKSVQRYNKYTNNDGQTNSFYITLVNSDYYLGYGRKTTSNDVEYDYVPQDRYDGSYGLTDSEMEQEIARDYPKIYMPSSAFQSVQRNVAAFFTKFSNFKDSRETVNLNIQFEFCSDTPDIVIGRKFLERQGIVSGTKETIFWYSTDAKYQYGDEQLKGHFNGLNPIVSFASPTVTNGFSQTSCKCTVNFGSSISASSVVCVNSNNELILAINLNQTNVHKVEFYLNMLMVRDRKVYLDKDMKMANDEVGEINFYKKTTSNDEIKVGDYYMLTYDSSSTNSYLLNPDATVAALEHLQGYNFIEYTRSANSDIIKNGYAIRNLWIRLDSDPQYSNSYSIYLSNKGQYFTISDGTQGQGYNDLDDTVNYTGNAITISDDGYATINSKAGNGHISFVQAAGTHDAGFRYKSIASQGDGRPSLYHLVSDFSASYYYEELKENISEEIVAVIGYIDLDENTGNVKLLKVSNMTNNSSTIGASSVSSYNDERIKYINSVILNEVRIKPRTYGTSNAYCSLYSLTLEKYIGIDANGKFVLGNASDVLSGNEIIDSRFAIDFDYQYDNFLIHSVNSLGKNLSFNISAFKMEQTQENKIQVFVKKNYGK